MPSIKSSAKKSLIGSNGKINLRVGNKVYDCYHPWNIGVVVRVLKTRVKVLFPYDPYYLFINDLVVTYDKAHLKFLRKI
jgi:hypothetical protein